MNLKILPIDGYEEKFLKYLDEIEEQSIGKNLDWIPSLRERYSWYLYWTICLNENDDIVAFSCIQDHFFEPGVVRILTRTWFNPDDRYKDGVLWRHTPVAPMAKKQIEWLQGRGYKKAIFTLEPHRGFNVLKFLSKKINARAGTNFIPRQDKIKTYPQATENEYQWYAEHLL